MCSAHRVAAPEGDQQHLWEGFRVWRFRVQGVGFGGLRFRGRGSGFRDRRGDVGAGVVQLSLIGWVLRLWCL